MAFISSSVYRIILAQFIATAIAAACFIAFDWVIAYSIFLGGMCSVIPGALAATRLLKSGPSWFTLFGVQVWKMASTILMFVAVFALVKPLNGMFFFGALLVVQLMYTGVSLVAGSDEIPGEGLDKTLELASGAKTADR